MTRTTKKPPTTDPKGRCGTYAGSRAHARRGEACCAPCLEEQRAYVRRKQQERRSRPEVQAAEHAREQLPEVKAQRAEYHRQYRAAHLEDVRAREQAKYWKTAHPEGPEAAREAHLQLVADRERKAREAAEWAEFLTTPLGVAFQEDLAEARELERQDRQRAVWRRKDRTARDRPGSPRRVRQLARRNRKRYGGKVPGVPSTGTLQDRLDYYGGKCWVCGADTAVVGLQWDHVKPLSHGGADMLANLRPACPSCNLDKSDQWPYTPPERTTP